MYHTTGFTKDEIIHLCPLIYANEEDCYIDPWPRLSVFISQLL